MTKHWSHHPGVRSGDDLSLGERSADRMRNGMGSWTFLGFFAIVMVIWVITAGFGSDPTPYFRMNLALSGLAGLQCAILLIAAKRADRVASELAQHDYEINRTTLARVEELLAASKERKS